MKKSIIEAIDYRMLINNTLCDYLQEKAKEGWIFYSLFADQLHYKKEEPQSLKFQCDYQIHDYEYDHMIEDMGYQEVCHYQNMTIYKNYNINALDLHTDKNVLSHVLKTHFKKQIKYHSLAFCLLILPVWFIFNYIFSFPLSLGFFFVNSSFFLLTLLLIVLSLCSLLSIIKYYYLYKTIDQNKEKYYPTYLQKVISILIYLLSFSLVIVVIEFIFVHFSFSHLLYILFVGGFALIIIHFMKKREINKKLISFILIFIYLIITSFSHYLPNEKQEQSSFKPYMINYTDYHKNKDIFVNKDEFNDYQTQDQDYANKKEIIEICLNHWIANKVMESEICFYENESRATPDVINQLLNENGTYQTGDIPFYSYKEALNQLTPYHHKLIDECYYNDYFMIARKDNKIVISYIQNEDNYLDKIIEHYF